MSNWWIAYIAIALPAWWLIARWLWLEMGSYRDGQDFAFTLVIAAALGGIWPVGLPIVWLLTRPPSDNTDWGRIGDRLFRTGASDD